MKANKFKEKLDMLKSTPPSKVKKSYYTFSREYPAGHIPIKRKKHTRVKSKPMKTALYAAVFLCILCVSFFAVNLGLDISYKAPSTNGGQITPVQGESLLVSGGVRCLYMPSEHLGDTDYIKSFIREIKKKNGNSVLIDFKTAEGKLNFTSMHEYAIAGKCSAFDNDTVRRALSLFKESKITVLGRIFCFKDSLVPDAVSELAVKYLDTDVNWLDGSNEKGGNPWLNPCLRRNINYLDSIVTELYGLGIKGFVLEACQFPDAQNISSAVFPGEKGWASRNQALKYFIKKVRLSLPSDAFVLLGLSATDAAEGNNSVFYGFMNDTAADGIAPDLSQRKTEYIIDKKTGYASMLSLYSSICQNNEGKAFVPVVNMQDYSRRFMSSMKKSGYESFILFDEKGEY